MAGNVQKKIGNDFKFKKMRQIIHVLLVLFAHLLIHWELMALVRLTVPHRCCVLVHWPPLLASFDLKADSFSQCSLRWIPYAVLLLVALQVVIDPDLGWSPVLGSRIASSLVVYFEPSFACSTYLSRQQRYFRCPLQNAHHLHVSDRSESYSFF